MAQRELEGVAERAHAYVGADLAAVCREGKVNTRLFCCVLGNYRLWGLKSRQSLHPGEDQLILADKT